MEADRIRIYMKANRSVEVYGQDVFLSDAASVFCTDKTIQKKVENIRLHHFAEERNDRCIISIMEIIAFIERVYPGAEVVSLGETDIILKKAKGRESALTRNLKIIFVACICFFGASFTIMAFHNDIGIVQVFARIYELITGKPKQGFGVLEIGYSLGLACGIIVFFNHIGKRRITRDPTPIEVEMKVYEEEVEKALIDLAEKEGMEIEY